jgi:hypothetical protein
MVRPARGVLINLSWVGRLTGGIHEALGDQSREHGKVWEMGVVRDGVGR